METNYQALTNLKATGCKYAFYYASTHGQPFFQANHDRFYSASLIKVPILLSWLYLEKAGEVERAELCDLDAEPQVQGAGFSWLLRARQLPYQDVLLMMIATSDNLCTNLIIRRAGIQRLNQVFHDVLGLKSTALERKLFDYEARARGLDNWISALDCIQLYQLIHALAPADRAFVDSLLAVCQDSLLLMRNLTIDSVVFHHKTGSITGVTHDWGYTDDCQIFLLTQDVADEVPVYKIFGELGELMDQ